MLELHGVEGLAFDKLGRERVQLVTVPGQDVLGPGVCVVDDRPHSSSICRATSSE